MRLGTLVVHLQPQVRLDDGAITGAEALVRWQHPQEGLVPPTAFLWALTDQQRSDVLRFVAAEAVALLCSDADVLPTVSVNAEPTDLTDANADFIAGLLADADLESGRLQIEVTEGAPGHTGEAHRCLHRLRDAGVRVSLDDFGKGYSSLARLHEVEVDEIKVDRALFAAAATAPRTATILRHVASLGRDLGIDTVAEGIETAAHAELARDLGFTTGQGFLWAPALPIHALSRWLDERLAVR